MGVQQSNCIDIKLKSEPEKPLTATLITGPFLIIPTSGCTVLSLSPRPGNVLVLPHVHDLGAHGHEKQNKEVNDQNRRIHGNI